MKVPRGIRGNNPGNIRKGEPWAGLAKEQTDKDFAVFIEPKYGIRALMKLLLNYSHVHHLETIREIISRWAPPNENNTVAYIQRVSQWVKVNPDSPLDLTDETVLKRLSQAIIMHENGQPPEELPDAWYPDQTYSEAYNLLFHKGA